MSVLFSSYMSCRPGHIYISIDFRVTQLFLANQVWIKIKSRFKHDVKHLTSCFMWKYLRLQRNITFSKPGNEMFNCLVNLKLSPVTIWCVNLSDLLSLSFCVTVSLFSVPLSLWCPLLPLYQILSLPHYNSIKSKEAAVSVGKWTLSLLPCSCFFSRLFFGSIQPQIKNVKQLPTKPL